MKALTNRQLLQALRELPAESLDMDVCVLNLSNGTVRPVWETLLASEIPANVKRKCLQNLAEELPILTITA